MVEREVSFFFYWPFFHGSPVVAFGDNTEAAAFVRPTIGACARGGRAPGASWVPLDSAGRRVAVRKVHAKATARAQRAGSSNDLRFVMADGNRWEGRACNLS